MRSGVRAGGAGPLRPSRARSLVLDDVRAGFRLHLGGSWEPLGVRPDLSAYSKAIANGYPLAAVLGRDSLRDAAQQVFVTGSFWFAAVPMAAALATIEALETERGIERMARAGTLPPRGPGPPGAEPTASGSPRAARSSCRS